MKRIWTIVAVFCATLTLQARRPNVILIMTDQQAAKAVGYAGNPDVRTPAMEFSALFFVSPLIPTPQ